MYVYVITIHCIWNCISVYFSGTYPRQWQSEMYEITTTETAKIGIEFKNTSVTGKLDISTIKGISRIWHT